MAVKLVPSQTGAPNTSSPIPYTGNPLLLCWADVLLFLKEAWSIVGICYPINQWLCRELDELYPSIPNLFCLALHGLLIVFQMAFLASLPFLIVFPVGPVFLYFAAVAAVNVAVCFLLNGMAPTLNSDVDLGNDARRHMDECWIYLNGVSVGKHWLQGNLDRLALTFRRPIIGVHNRTYGIIFDLIQCIIERNFAYATMDIRNSYAVVKKCLLAEEHAKVVLILHSQGGIEGGLILDWLLSELPTDIIQKLEIYTFGSAANHFNNPHRNSAYMHLSQSPTVTGHNTKVVSHIEHYASDGDFVARWGVLSFAKMQNRYMGRIFVRSGMGHLLNQHYLNAMFPLDNDRRVREENGFMDAEVAFKSEGVADKARDGLFETILHNGNGGNGALVEDIHSPVEPVSLSRADAILAAKMAMSKPKVRDFSRLWEYRNGGVPDDSRSVKSALRGLDPSA